MHTPRMRLYSTDKRGEQSPPKEEEKMKYRIAWTQKDGTEIKNQIFTADCISGHLNVLEQMGATNIKIESIEEPKMNKPRYCGRKEQERMTSNGWRIELAEFRESPEEMYKRLSRYHEQVKIYWDTTMVKGYHEYFAMVKR